VSEIRASDLLLICSGGDEPAKWYKFDDGEVSECKMDDDEEMKSQCFGGDYVGEVFDHMLKRSVLLISSVGGWGTNVAPRHFRSSGLSVSLFLVLFHYFGDCGGPLKWQNRAAYSCMAAGQSSCVHAWALA